MFEGIFYLIMGLGLTTWLIMQFSFVKEYKAWKLIPWLIVGILLSLLTTFGAVAVIFNF